MSTKYWHEKMSHSAPSYDVRVLCSRNRIRSGPKRRSDPRQQQLAKLGLCIERPRNGDSRRRHHIAKFRNYLALNILCFFCSCGAPTPWKFESIQTGEALYDSKRLSFIDPSSPLRFEIMRTATDTAVFLSLTKYQFTPDTEVKMELTIDGERTEETIPFLEGKMRLKIPPIPAERIIAALQEGKKVGIMIDGFEQELRPAQFASHFAKMGQTSIRNPFKGLFDP